MYPFLLYIHCPIHFILMQLPCTPSLNHCCYKYHTIQLQYKSLVHRAGRPQATVPHATQLRPAEAATQRSCARCSSCRCRTPNAVLLLCSCQQAARKTFFRGPP